MNMSEIAHAQAVPIAIPWICLYVVLLNLKKLVLRTNLRSVLRVFGVIEKDF
jgi:hypothetical protein